MIFKSMQTFIPWIDLLCSVWFFKGAVGVKAFHQNNWFEDKPEFCENVVWPRIEISQNVGIKSQKSVLFHKILYFIKCLLIHKIIRISNTFDEVRRKQCHDTHRSFIKWHNYQTMSQKYLLNFFEFAFHDIVKITSNWLLFIHSENVYNIFEELINFQQSKCFIEYGCSHWLIFSIKC